MAFSYRIGPLATGLLDLVWPRQCVLCAASMDGETEYQCVCPTCQNALTDDRDQTCPRCASTVGPHADVSKGCPRCVQQTYRFTAAVRLGRYDGLLRQGVLKAKHEPGEPLAEELGRMLAAVRRDVLTGWKPDAVAPVPLHWRRRWRRGYNQSAAVARGVSEALGLPLAENWLRRTRDTASQTTMSPSSRWENMRGAFRVRRPSAVRGLRVLLVDDVLTTGATGSAAAAALMDAGAAQVTVAVLAHR